MENLLSQSDINKGLRYSIIDGIFANLFGTLTGGIFLISFALYIGANELQIGLIASIPLLANSAQLLSSYIIEKTRKRREVSIGFSGIARGIWILIVFSLLLYSQPEKPSYLISFVIIIIAISYVSASISVVSWLSWMSDLVKEDIRGRYFSKRNIMCGIAGLLVTLLGGRFLDYWKINYEGNLNNGFIFIFLAALFFGLISIVFLKKIPEPPFTVQRERISFFKGISLPLKDPNFKRYIFFTAFWSFSVHFVSPFFTVYMIQDLKLSYTLISEMAIISILADIVGMRLWGILSDRYGNKPVILFNGYIASFIPFLWIFITRESIGFLILVHLTAGFFWAGLNLCTSNLLLRLSPKEHKSIYISYFNAIGGLIAAIAPIIGGMAAQYFSQWRVEILSFEIYRLHFVFLISFLLRLISISYFNNIKEPAEVPVSKMMRVIRNIRGLNTLMGFNHLHHYFIEVKRKMARRNNSEMH
ncbi:MAG TPA: MFS transporter [Nitrospinota bacterium]|nr:MFS transporter [Nitrospinota bacterium]